MKVLDFGLAKALDPHPEGDPSQSPTLTAAATQMGVIMGTAAYMSPEQARGSTVDSRADIWSFGVVLFEMLTGKQLFTGATMSDTLAAVLRARPTGPGSVDIGSWAMYDPLRSDPRFQALLKKMNFPRRSGRKALLQRMNFPAQG